jgi:hypothetical protein
MSHGEQRLCTSICSCRTVYVTAIVPGRAFVMKCLRPWLSILSDSRHEISCYSVKVIILICQCTASGMDKMMGRRLW